MIKVSAWSEWLNKAIKNGIGTVFISKTNGEILCIEGKETSHTITDIVSSTWNEYFQLTNGIFTEEQFKYWIIENEDSNIIVGNLLGYLISMKADLTFNWGTLKKHWEAWTKQIEKALEPYKETIWSRFKENKL